MMNLFLQKRLYSHASILELRDYAKSQKKSLGRKEIRSSVKIAIVDDEKFAAHGNLANYGYDIREYPDINSLDEIIKYDVILCDLMGVGKGFDQALGGASIIKEIKENYPTKYVIAYTGARSNTTEANAAKEFADDFLKKDAEITKWVERLDEAIDFASDPYERWLVTRRGLLDEEVDIRRVVELESAYVKAIQDKDPELSLLRNASDQLDLSGHSKGIIQSLIASGIYTLIFAP